MLREQSPAAHCSSSFPGFSPERNDLAGGRASAGSRDSCPCLANKKGIWRKVCQRSQRSGSLCSSFAVRVARVQARKMLQAAPPARPPTGSSWALACMKAACYKESHAHQRPSSYPTQQNAWKTMTVDMTGLQHSAAAQMAQLPCSLCIQGYAVCFHLQTHMQIIAVPTSPAPSVFSHCTNNFPLICAMLDVHSPVYSSS